MSAAKRKAEERQRKRDAGLVPVEVWVKREFVQTLREFVAKLNGRK